MTYEEEVVLEEAEEEPEGSSGKMKIITLIVVVVLVAAAAGGIYMYKDKLFGSDDGGGNGNGNGNGNFTPLVSIEADSYALVGTTVDFSGHTDLNESTYSWDFDDDDGIQEDATGKEVSHLFDTTGSYTVTLTVEGTHEGKSYTKDTTHSIMIRSEDEMPPSCTLTIQEIPETPLTRYDYTIYVDSTSPANSTGETSGIMVIVYNGTDWTDPASIKFNGTLDSMDEYILPPTAPPEDCFHFNDLDGNNELTVNDEMWINGDGGYGFDSGDNIILLYTPEDNWPMCAPITIP